MSPQQIVDEQIATVLAPKHPGGRPTVVTAEVELKLIAALQMGMTDTTACQYAEISRETFYKRCRDHQGFADKMQSARNFLKLKAGQRVVSILDKGIDRDAGPMARWALERLEPEQFAPKPEVVINNNVGYEPPSWFTSTKTIEGETDEATNQTTELSSTPQPTAEPEQHAPQA